MVGSENPPYGQRSTGNVRYNTEGDTMRENFAADWAFGIRGAIENTVRTFCPQHLRQWPLLQAFDFEAYDLNGRYACIVFRDKMSGITAGPGILRPFPFRDIPAQSPSVETIEAWQSYLRSRFDLRQEDAAFVIPIYDSGKRTPEDFELFNADERRFWDYQLAYVISHYKAHLETFQNAAPPQSVNITYNVSGQNTRVNINSTDSSTNTIDLSSHAVFNNLLEAAASIQNSKNREAIEASINEMNKSVGTRDFGSRYKAFMAVIADHITVFAPMLAQLAALL